MTQKNETEKSVNWHLQGNYFESCNCQSACPCVWLQPPSEGNCKLLVAWHIDTGHFEKINLDGLNIALACYAPDHMMNGQWQAALYVDETASDEQYQAITQIFSGQAGGHPEILMSLVGEVLGIKKVKINYVVEGNFRKLDIPDIASLEIESICGITGDVSTINNPPLCVVSSHPSVVAKSKHYRFTDYDKNWSFSDRNGYFSEFVYQP